MKTCKCTLRGKTVGDGCQVCNPDLVIEMLQDEVNEQATEIAQLQANNLKLRDAVDIDNLHWLIAYLYMQNEIGRAEKLRTITNAISSTPAQSLQDHDAAVASGRQFGKQNLARLFIELKGKQK